LVLIAEITEDAEAFRNFFLLCVLGTLCREEFQFDDMQQGAPEWIESSETTRDFRKSSMSRAKDDLKIARQFTIISSLTRDF
jgi:hypothetical protein